jgi:histidinol-phosphate/aromatic aminotransferase/cobyric acid decarboxylase-like protein/adenosyl cobinamide kinase/adenosyl cobinamide phosphate guanylyltransferase
MSLILVIGGTRSGKSAHAERLAAMDGQPVRYLATADPADASMRERIARHVARRPPSWETVVSGDDLAAAVASDGLTLLDGLGVWIAGALHRGLHVAPAIDRLIETARRVPVVVVAEEAGQGVLPMDAVPRAWLDALGEATQRLSGAAERVDLVVAGRALRLGGPAPAAPPELRRHGDVDARATGTVDHAVNVLEPGPPSWLREALSTALSTEAIRYPHEEPALGALAAHHGRDPQEVVATNGAAEALWLLGPALRPRLAACVHPGFTESEAGLRAHGVPVVRVQRDPDAGFRLDPDLVPDEADLVVVGQPASPSGTLDPASALLALRRPGRTVVADEAFMSMVPGEPGSLAGERLDDVIVIRSLTKLLSIPGLRAGYAIAPLRLATALRAVRPPWSANAMALAALRAAAEHPAELAALAERAAGERDDLARRLAAVPGLRTWPSATNFCLIEVADGAATVATLRRRGIVVRPAGSFPGLGAGHIRLTARTPERNARLVGALVEALT